MAFYPFDGNTKDASGNGNNGINQGAKTDFDRFGFENSSMLFSPAFQSSFSISNSTFIPIGPRTYSLWFRISSETQKYNQPHQVLISRGNAINEGWRLLLAKGGDGSYGIAYDSMKSTGGLDNNGIDLTIPAATAFRWHHLVFSINTPSDTFIAIDGLVGKFGHIPAQAFVDLVKQLADSILVEKDLVFGFCPNGGYFFGNIDNIRIYNYALSKTAASSLFRFEKNPPLRAATAKLQIANGFIIGVSVTDGGSGYTNIPNVNINGSGSGATAIASVANGMVTGITMISAGQGYDTSTSITIDPPPTPPSQATADAAIANGKVSTVIISDGGSGYGSSIPPVSIIGGGGVGAKAVANVVNGSVVGVTITSSGSAYTSIPTVLIAAPPGLPKASIVVKQVELDMELIVGYSYKIQTSYDGGNTWSDTASAFLATDSVMTKVFTVTSTGQLFRVVQVN